MVAISHVQLFIYEVNRSSIREYFSSPPEHVTPSHNDDLFMRNVSALPKIFLWIRWCSNELYELKGEYSRGPQPSFTLQNKHSTSTINKPSAFVSQTAISIDISIFKFTIINTKLGFRIENETKYTFYYYVFLVCSHVFFS